MANLNFCCRCEKSYRNENAFHYYYRGSHKKNAIPCSLSRNLFRYTMNLDKHVEAVHQSPTDSEEEVVVVQEVDAGEEEAANSHDEVAIV
ncbi:hypothetical protein ACOSP7_024450 [Xanthoceras sorbifolium]